MGKIKTIEPEHIRDRRVAVGVDPSLNNTAFAVWDLDRRTFTAFATYEWTAGRKIGMMIHAGAALASFFVEDPSQHTFIYRRVLKKWHDRMTKQQFQKWLAQINSQAMAIGKNQGAAQLLIAEWEAYGMRVIPKTPGRKKLKAPAFEALTGCSMQTNQDERDAGMYVFGM